MIVGAYCIPYITIDDKPRESNTPPRSPSQTLGAIVRGYKSSVTKQLGLMGFKGKLWQGNYYEHIIRNEPSYQTLAEYVINNPLKWLDDKFYMSGVNSLGFKTMQINAFFSLLSRTTPG